ncbi:vegetative cell wall protein gp1 [Triticum aestivum]|uniref:vegetative cell wall protein gp1 n=1 Tax=Triticum aestivum TaxID=4565 RepID=UPI001D02DA2A|nr:vegetative cell wall protein gp1-like [Triticum aestivum]
MPSPPSPATSSPRPPRKRSPNSSPKRPAPPHPWCASWPPSTCCCCTPAATARGFRWRTPWGRPSCRCLTWPGQPRRACPAALRPHQGGPTQGNHSRPASASPTCPPASPATSSASSPSPPSGGSSSPPAPSRSTARSSRPRFGTPSALPIPVCSAAVVETMDGTIAEAPFCLFQLDAFGLLGIRPCSRRFAFALDANGHHDSVMRRGRWLNS